MSGVMDRYDVMTVLALLATSIAIGLNLTFLQADAAAGTAMGQLVLIPIFAGLAVGLSGFVEHIRRRGRDMVMVSRISLGSLIYLALSAGCSALYQPRLTQGFE
jgi:hypothetical protein